MLPGGPRMAKAKQSRAEEGELQPQWIPPSPLLAFEPGGKIGTANPDWFSRFSARSHASVAQSARRAGAKKRRGGIITIKKSVLVKLPHFSRHPHPPTPKKDNSRPKMEKVPSFNPPLEIKCPVWEKKRLHLP